MWVFGILSTGKKKFTMISLNMFNIDGFLEECFRGTEVFQKLEV